MPSILFLTSCNHCFGCISTYKNTKKIMTPLLLAFRDPPFGDLKLNIQRFMQLFKFSFRLIKKQTCAQNWWSFLKTSTAYNWRLEQFENSLCKEWSFFFRKKKLHMIKVQFLVSKFDLIESNQSFNILSCFFKICLQFLSTEYSFSMHCSWWSYHGRLMLVLFSPLSLVSSMFIMFIKL
jgi:hypothetical protein